MTCIDFVFTRSKVEVKVARVLYVKKWFPLSFLRTFCHRDIIFHLLIGLSEYMTPIYFGFSRLRSKSQGSLVKNINMVSSH